MCRETAQVYARLLLRYDETIKGLTWRGRFGDALAYFKF